MDSTYKTNRTNSKININGGLLDITRPCIMGIINITPDSFYEKSRITLENDIIVRINQMLEEGAKIIDIGAYSSRPGAENINEKAERERLEHALTIIRKTFPDIILSLDTFRSAIAYWAVKEYNVNIINDISGGNLDTEMFKTIAKLRVPYILMHMRGTPQNMNQFTKYNNVIHDVIFELSEKVYEMRLLGIADIIIDPGFGFAKTIKQNFELLNNLDKFQIFNSPILAGISRKSMIYKTLECTAEEALNGSTVLNTIALLKGVNILRVHDVKEAMEAIKLTNIE